MPVFDNPRRELQRLQEELLAQEEELEALEDLEEEDFFEGEYEEPPLIRNYANRYGADIRNFANGYRGEALFDPEDEEYDEEPDYAVSREKRLPAFPAEKAEGRFCS